MMKNEVFTPINILWVEDNPLWHRAKCSDVTDEKGERIFDSSLDEESLPVISLTGELAGKGHEKNFNLKVLQHPEEIKEYFSLCLKVEDQYGSKALGNVEGVVPEMVVFDYKFYDNIKTNQSSTEKFPMSYSLPTQPIRKFVNPNFAILNKFAHAFPDFQLYLESPKSSSYDEYEFIERIYSPDELDSKEKERKKEKILDDEFGLYAGIEIVKLFRHHACIGIPATANKAERKLLHPFSRFYEWLNQNDLSTALYREERGNKTWNSILKDGVKQLRKRIIALVQTGHITPSYEQLIKLSESNNTNGIFSFTSAYGERHLPLEGLFIDKIQTVREWASELIKVFSSKSDDVKEAIKVSDMLWETFCSEKFVKRIQLSDLTYRVRSSKLTNYEKNKLKILRTEFIPKGKKLIENEISIRTLIPNPKGKQAYLRPAKNAIFRLAVLHLVTRATIAMNKCGEYASDREIYRDLDAYEYFNILFPIVNLKSDLILPMHGNPDKKKSLTDTNLRRLRERLEINEGKNPDAEWHEFGRWLSDGEKILLRAIYFKDHNYYPSWLK